MPLIYAFMDESGQWHGEPEAEIYESTSHEDTLLYQPRPEMEGGMNRFVGQRLRVRYADIGRERGPAPYQVEGGGSYHPTFIVYELLTEPAETPKTSIPQQRRASTLEERDRSTPDTYES